MTAVFERILEMSLTAAVVIVVVLLIRLLLRKAPRKYSYALWIVAAFRLVCPVSFRSAVSLFNLAKGVEQVELTQTIPEPVVTPMPSVTSAPYPGPPLEIDPDLIVTIPVEPAVTAPVVEPEVTVNLLERAMDFAAVVWLVGLAALVIYGIISYVRLRRRMSTAVVLESRVWQSDRVQSPFILGFARPKIYLPFGLTVDQQRYVLSHERYHLKRLDHIVRPLSFLILAVHWFNPLVWAAYYLMSRDMEMSCDEKVLSTEENIRREYSTTLLSFAANRRFPSPSPLAFGESGVKGRIKNALNWKKPRTWVTIIAIILCIVVIIVCAANPLAHPHEWTNSLTVEDVEWAELMVNTEERTYRGLSEGELEKLVALLNGLRRGEMEQPPPLSAWAFPTERMLTICCDGIEYILNLGPTPMTIICKDESVAWGNDDPWFVSNEDLKQFIRDLAAEEAPADPADPDPGEPILPTEELSTWHADLTHDGVDEVITLRRQNSEVPYGYSLTVTASYGKELWRGDASDWRGGQNGFYLYEKDGKHYLMQWWPAGQQGWNLFSYQLFSLSNTGEVDILAENSLQYDFGTYEYRDRLLEVDIEELRAFEAEVNALLKDTTALLVIHNETTILGDPSSPVTDLWESPADDWEWQQKIILDQQADREARTLAVWPLNDLTLTVVETREDGFYLIDVYGANNYHYWSTYVDRMADNLMYFRYEENGVQYLMELSPGGSQGVGMWSYRIFSVSPEALPVLRENSLNFQSTNVAEALAVDVEALRAFVDEVNALLEHAELIAGFENRQFLYSTPGADTPYRWDPPMVEIIEESQNYWRGMEEKLNGAVTEQVGRYYTENLMQPGGKGHGQFMILDKYMDKRGATVWAVASFIETDGDGNWLAEYSNLPMMFTFDMVNEEYVLTEAWVEEKGKNFDAHDDVKERFPPAAAQAVIDGVHAAVLHLRITESMDLPIGLTWTDWMDEITVPLEVMDFAYSYICSTHPDAQAAQVDSMEVISTAAVGTISGHPMYRLIYSVMLDGRWHPNKEIYLVLHHDWSSSSDYWYACGAVTQQEIDTTYSTEAMMEKYNSDPYLAAVLETVQKWRANR